jgi:hypothetical protein
MVREKSARIFHPLFFASPESKLSGRTMRFQRPEAFSPGKDGNEEKYITFVTAEYAAAGGQIGS